MSEKNDGGPAFPTEPNTQPGRFAHHGMTLRDWFAGQAMAAIYASEQGWARANQDAAPPVEIAFDAYELADAMLKARGEA